MFREEKDRQRSVGQQLYKKILLATNTKKAMKKT